MGTMRRRGWREKEGGGGKALIVGRRRHTLRCVPLDLSCMVHANRKSCFATRSLPKGLWSRSTPLPLRLPQATIAAGAALLCGLSRLAVTEAYGAVTDCLGNQGLLPKCV